MSHTATRSSVYSHGILRLLVLESAYILVRNCGARLELHVIKFVCWLVRLALSAFGSSEVKLSYGPDEPTEVLSQLESLPLLDKSAEGVLHD